jgi:hypothetical protein
MHDAKASRPVFEPGRPGASARAEYERRVRRDEARRVARYGRWLGPIIGALTGPEGATTNWARGSEGEERVGRYLTETIGPRGVLLHDRAVPGRHANVDHIAVVPSGVWVIDTKRYRGKVELRRGWFGTSPQLFVHGRNRTNLVSGALWQRQVVQEIVGHRTRVRVALCFTEAEWGFFAKPFAVRDVLVTWPRRMAGALREPGTVARRDVNALAQLLDRALPPYGRSSTPVSALDDEGRGNRPGSAGGETVRP